MLDSGDKARADHDSGADLSSVARRRLDTNHPCRDLRDQPFERRLRRRRLSHRHRNGDRLPTAAAGSGHRHERDNRNPAEPQRPTHSLRLVRLPPSSKRGRFTSEADLEWCDRRLLARIHRLTLEGLRRLLLTD